MVALEAASNGAEIVLTNDGGPKYYLAGHAEIVNPYSVDEIGLAVKKLLDNNVYQPELLQYMKDNFSPEACSKKMLDIVMTNTHLKIQIKNKDTPLLDEDFCEEIKADD